jgi:endonuclease/exonuclease/phosphatase family metal-dependent hydrolase
MPPLDFNLVAYNVFLRPSWLPFLDGQRIRGERLPAHLIEPDYDAIVFNELFHAEARRSLLDRLESTYPYRTLLVGAGVRHKLCGGVMLVSRWPIEAQAERLFDVAEGFDAAASKGIVYARIRKHDQWVNVFATHTNAMPRAHRVRARQFATLRSFIDECQVPADEPALIAGDLNVDPVDLEYPAMLATLNAEVPPLRGLRYSYDPVQNRLAGGRERQLLDYVLYSARHRQPSACSAEVFQLHTRPWRQRSWQRRRQDLSDHYPVIGRFHFT